MAGFFTEHVNNAVLDLVLGGMPLDPPPVLYFGLSRGAANRAGAVSEPAGADYARAEVRNHVAAFPLAERGSKGNGRPIRFGAPQTSWGTIASVFIADAPVGGNVLAMADLASPKTIAAGAPAPVIAPGGLHLRHE